MLKETEKSPRAAMPPGKAKAGLEGKKARDPKTVSRDAPSPVNSPPAMESPKASPPTATGADPARNQHLEPPLGQYPQEEGQQRLLNELRIQRNELEMQNEELRRTRDDAEAALEQYYNLYEFSPVSFFTVSQKGRIHDCNITAALLLGVERFSLRNTHFQVWVKDSDLKKFASFIRDAFSGDQEFSCEVALNPNNSPEKVVLLKAGLLEAGKGAHKLCRLAALDITLAKQAEKDLERSRELDAIFQNAPVSMILLDENLRVIKANRSALALTNRGENEALELWCGQMLRCVHSVPLGCGLTPACQSCAIRHSAMTTLISGQACQQIEARLRMDLGPEQMEQFALISTSLLIIGGRRLILVCIEIVTELIKAQNKLRAYQRSLKDLASELFVAEERERRRIAADLHDSVVQRLGLSSQKLKLLRSGHADPGQSLEDVIQSIDQAIIESRTLIGDLSPPVLHLMGLVPALEGLAQSFRERRGLAVELDLSPLPQRLSKDLSVFLYRSCNELLNNVIKHAQVSWARLSLECTDYELRLSVEDSGDGFTYVDNQDFTRRGFGLFNIREMLRDWWGKLYVEKTASGGAKVTMTIPTPACWPASRSEER